MADMTARATRLWFLVATAVAVITMQACQVGGGATNERTDELIALATTTSTPATGPTTAIPPKTTTTTVEGAIVVVPGTNLQSLVDSNSAGTMFLLKAGTHRNLRVTPKEGNIFIGESGAVMDGGGTTDFAFIGDVKNVTIQGLTIENYANPPQTGAINGWGWGWKVIDNEIRYNAGGGVGLNTDFVIDGNNIHHNEQIGILARGANGRVVNNEISYNNYNDRYAMDWEAGGTKFLFTTNLYVAYNYVHDNHGAGLWTDGRNYGTVYERNTVRNNYGPGILHEVSYDAVIRNNVVTGNAHPFYVGGILVASSSNVEVYGNTLSGNDGGIVGIQDDRESPPIGGVNRGPLVITGLYVHDNDVAFTTGWNGVRVNSGPDVTQSGTILFDNNTYQLGSDPTPFKWGRSGFILFKWGRSDLTIEQWKALGFDLNGFQ